MPDNAERWNIGHMSKQPRTLPTGVKDCQQCPKRHRSAFRKDREKRTKAPTGTNPVGVNPESRCSLKPLDDLNTQLIWPKSLYEVRKKTAQRLDFRSPRLKRTVLCIRNFSFFVTSLFSYGGLRFLYLEVRCSHPSLKAAGIRIYVFLQWHYSTLLRQ
jgi:hypothetical protein